MELPMQFNAKKPTQSGISHQISPLITRIIANNASPFTFTGTCSYIIGNHEIAILDPGSEEDEAHLQSLIKVIDGRPVKAILISHTHKDHSPLSRALAKHVKAPIIGAKPYEIAQSKAIGLDASHDKDHRPDQILEDGDCIFGDGWTLETVATPGHTANHLCFALQNTDYLFSADHIMGWNTTIIAPPDGNMKDYIASIDKLLQREENSYLPGHGDLIPNGKKRAKAIKSHRMMRERVIIKKLANFNEEPSLEIFTKLVYPHIEPNLMGAAMLSTFSHLEKIAEEGNEKAHLFLF